MKPHYVFHKECNFCHFNKRKILFSIAHQNLVCCTRCKLVYFTRQRSDLANLYSDEYYAKKNTNSEANYANYENQEKTMKRNFSFAYSFLNKLILNKKIDLLEIGAGYGYFLKNLSKSIKVEAVEVSREAVVNLRSSGIKTYAGEVQTLGLKKRFSVIVLFDVIEHQLYLREFMQELHRLLKKDGYIIITTPDFGSFLNRFLGVNAPTIQPLYHNYFFTPQWIKTNFPKVGFDVISIRTVHLTFLCIGQILLMVSFALPFTKKLHLISIAKKIHLDTVIIPFFRVGGIETIVQKV